MELIAIAVIGYIAYIAWKGKRDSHHHAMFEHYRRNLIAAIPQEIHESGSGRWFLATYQRGHLHIQYFDSWEKVAEKLPILDQRGTAHASGSVTLDYVSPKECGEYAIRDMKKLIATTEGGR
jgi:hypothetical protein